MSATAFFSLLRIFHHERPVLRFHSILSNILTINAASTANAVEVVALDGRTEKPCPMPNILGKCCRFHVMVPDIHDSLDPTDIANSLHSWIVKKFEFD